MNELGIPKAIWHAILGKKLDYYPRRPDAQILSADLIAEIKTQLHKVNFNNEDEAKIYIEQAKGSFSEVKEATEYQDQKTARLLTIMAFLTAAAGAVFSKILDIYPLRFPMNALGQEALISLMYGLFGLYMLFVSVGALICFHAMQTRFFVPTDHDTVKSENPRSFLFFKYIMTNEPSSWGAKFGSPTLDLLAEYYKNYVVETYLIAVKIGDKVRYLRPAQRLLQWAIKVLVLWVISVAITLCYVKHQDPLKVLEKTPEAETKAIKAK